MESGGYERGHPLYQGFIHWGGEAFLQNTQLPPPPQLKKKEEKSGRREREREREKGKEIGREKEGRIIYF
jgi:hypothetical protein